MCLASRWCDFGIHYSWELKYPFSCYCQDSRGWGKSLNRSREKRWWDAKFEFIHAETIWLGGEINFQFSGTDTEVTRPSSKNFGSFPGGAQRQWPESCNSIRTRSALRRNMLLQTHWRANEPSSIASTIHVIHGIIALRDSSLWTFQADSHRVRHLSASILGEGF